MTQQTKHFIIQNYGKASTFASFLPGISGIYGTPIWCYYVNRGQGIVSFGVDNKDHAIMEFYPAHQAYQNVKTTGFRTFLKINGVVTEPFSDEEVPHSMDISMNGLKIEEKNETTGIETTVEYFTLPGEKLGGLVRKLVLKNQSSSVIELEVLDGMPALIPYGVGLDSMKNMLQTAKAWMQVEDVESDIPFYRVRASMADTAAVTPVLGGNFAFAVKEDGSLLSPIADPMLVFDYDCAMRKAVGFENHSLEALYEAKQIISNQLPCAFFGTRETLVPGASVCIYELIGQVEKKEILLDFAAEKHDGAYFAAKKKEAETCVEELCSGIATETADSDFDAYCNYTYMDNVLRGGYPIHLGHNKIFYVYSRKHGDLERDYNYFSMLPECYSQGNGNFRDVNQNRRCDTFFAPFVERENIREFYSLIQLDGYNPLGIEKRMYQLSGETADRILNSCSLSETEKTAVKEFTEKPFTPGTLHRFLEERFMGDELESVFIQLIDFADSKINANFGEGYWSDHWTYNLDLILDYLEVFPEKEKEMLYERAYTTFLSQVNINPRRKRYEVTANGLRQYHALDEAGKRNTAEKLVRTDYGKGSVLKMTLLEKLVLLCATKYAALDAYGMGIEMEGGKPGWYDALNGMPGLFGSSMAESYELCRMLEYTIGALKKYPGELALLDEFAEFLGKLARITEEQKAAVAGCADFVLPEDVKTQGELLAFWNQVNDAKEAYRETVFAGISGHTKTTSGEQVADILESFLATVQCGIEKAVLLGEGICPTYFTYEVPEYEETEDGYNPLHFEVKTVPYFLEGPVRYLKLKNRKEKKLKLYEKVKNSDLYDSKLQMYKVNASLADASYELGRARAFTPGWLENESIWLHMEYKYLLELIRSGLYEEFFSDFHKAAVPFLDPKVYGRSIYENSSFIASSKNPNVSYHGKGFVARLSGSTIEFISMWKLMMFGAHVFECRKGELIFAPEPAIPDYLIPETGRVSATLLGKTKVTYQFADVMDYIPGKYRITAMKFLYKNGSVTTQNGAFACGQTALDIRNGAVAEIEIEIV